MRHVTIIALAIFVVGFIAGCVPTITVTNSTKIPVRAIVGAHERADTVISPEPGQSDDVEASEGGYAVYAIPDVEWIGRIKEFRQVLIGELADPANINAPTIVTLIDELRQLQDLISAYDREAKSKHGSICYGYIKQDQDVANTNISTDSSGALVVTCQ